MKSTDPLYELYDYCLFPNQPLSNSQDVFYEYYKNYYNTYGMIPNRLSCWFYDGMYHLARGLNDAI